MTKQFRLIAMARNMGNRRGEITVYSEIYPYNWGDNDPTVSSNNFIKELAGLDVDELTVRINSPGGVVSEAIAIRTALIKHPAKKTIDIEGCCASAATLIACMPGARVRMARGGEYMIHCCRGGARGKAEDILSAYNAMVMTDKNISGIYAERTGKTEEECMALMKAETWYSAEDAIADGFVDEIISCAEDDMPICACAFDAEVMEVMRASYDHVPEHFHAEERAQADGTGAGKPQDNPVSNGSAVVADVPTENKTKGVNTMELKNATAEALRMENPALAKGIAEDAIKAERERVKRINALTRKGEKWQAMAKKAIEDGTSAEDFLSAVIAEEEKTHADYLNNRKSETAAAGEVGGGDTSDHDNDLEARMDKAAREVAELAKGMSGDSASMA